MSAGELTPRSRLRWVLSALVSVGFLAWWWQSGAWSEVGALFQVLTAPQWVLLTVGLWLSYAVRAWRLHAEFQGRCALRWADWLRITLMHNALVNWLPFRSGELAFPLLLRREAQLPVAQSVSALIWLRVQDALMLVALAAWFWPREGHLLQAAALALLAAGIWGLPWVLQRGGAWTMRPRWAAWRDAFTSRHRHAAPIWGLTALNWGLKLAIQAQLLMWLSGGAWSWGWAGAVGAELAVFSPVQGWAGVGTYEAGAAWAMSWHGVSLAQGAQWALVLHAWVLLNATLAGALAGLVTVRAGHQRPDVSP
jgi:hypothetical protein